MQRILNKRVYVLVDTLHKRSNASNFIYTLDSLKYIISVMFTRGLSIVIYNNTKTTYLYFISLKDNIFI